MVLSDRVLVTSYRLSIVTMSQSAAVWPQFLRCMWCAPIPKLLACVKICQVLTILHQLICRGVANFGTWCVCNVCFDSLS